MDYLILLVPLFSIVGILYILHKFISYCCEGTDGRDTEGHP